MPTVKQEFEAIVCARVRVRFKADAGRVEYDDLLGLSESGRERIQPASRDEYHKRLAASERARKAIGKHADTEIAEKVAAKLRAFGPVEIVIEGVEEVSG